jgi:hypothetical protein
MNLGDIGCKNAELVLYGSGYITALNLCVKKDWEFFDQLSEVPKKVSAPMTWSSANLHLLNDL